MTGTSRRLQKEISELRTLPETVCRILEINEANLLNWSILLLPVSFRQSLLFRILRFWSTWR